MIKSSNSKAGLRKVFKQKGSSTFLRHICTIAWNNLVFEFFLSIKVYCNPHTLKRVSTLELSAESSCQWVNVAFGAYISSNYTDMDQLWSVYTFLHFSYKTHFLKNKLVIKILDLCTFRSVIFWQNNFSTKVILSVHKNKLCIITFFFYNN